MQPFAPIVVYHGHAAFTCPPGWNWHSTTNRWTGLHLWLVTAGRGWMTTPAGKHPAGAGDCFVLRMEEENIGVQDDAHPLVVHAVNFDLLDPVGRPAAVPVAKLPRHRHLRETALLGCCIDLAVAAHLREEQVEAAHWTRSALLLVHEADRRPPPADDSTACLLDALCRRITAHPGARYPVAALAEELHWSPDHFIRAFRRHTGLPPGEYVIAARIAEARRLLRYTSHSVSHIAALLGYNTPFFFSRQFRRHTGVSPSAYRVGVEGDTRIRNPETSATPHLHK